MREVSRVGADDASEGRDVHFRVGVAGCRPVRDRPGPPWATRHGAERDEALVELLHAGRQRAREFTRHQAGAEIGGYGGYGSQPSEDNNR